MTLFYHVRPMDLHAPGEHCNTYDCSSVVMGYDYDALAARLAEAERLLRELPVACACECLADVKDDVDAFLRTAEGKPDVPR